MAAPAARSDRWTDEFLDRMRGIGDPEADQCVRKYFEPGPPERMAELAGRLLAGAGRVEELPQDVRLLVEPATDGAGELDHTALAHGQALFQRYGPEILWVLACYSLPAAYAAPRGVRVLRHTGRLRDKPELRLLDTALILTRVMGPHALAPGHPGVRAARKVRLIHAVQRARILADPSIHWDEDERLDQRPIPLGVPINQEDLAGTLLTFSTAVLQGLDALGIRVERAAQEAYMTTWAALGGILGVHPDLVPHTVEEGERLMERIHERQHGPSQDGVEMCAALIGLMRHYQPYFLRHLPAAMIRFFMRDHPEVPDYLAVPNHRHMRPVVLAVVSATRALRGLLSRSGLYRRACYPMMRVFLHGMRGDRREDFEIPEELMNEWFSRRRVARLRQ